MICAVRGCSNSTYRLHKWMGTYCPIHDCNKGTSRCVCEPPFRLITFPTERKDPKRRAEWIKCINRKNEQNGEEWEPSRSFRVCSDHFVDGAPSTSFPNPTLKLEPESPPKQRPAVLEKIKNPTSNSVPSVSIISKNKSNRKSKLKADGVHIRKRNEMTPHLPKTTTISSTLSHGKDIEIEWPDLVDLSIQHRQLQDAYTFLQAEVDTLSAQNDRLKEDLYRALPRLSYGSLKGDDEQLLFLTGLRSFVFEWLALQVSTKIERLLPELTSLDHLLMALMKLKLGICDTDLAFRFAIQEISVTRICQTWIPALAAALRPLVAWPSVDIVSQNRPSVFRGKFRRCRCVIDCPEFAVMGAGDVETTVKYFACVTPAGAVSFLSSGYSSTTPERTIIQESGFFHLVDPNDEILANRLIPIRDELTSLRASLHVPDAFDGKTKQKSDFEKRLCHIRNHVKKLNGWWKEFNILQKVIPEPYTDLVDEILIVCAVLTNINLSLTPKVSSRT